MAFESAQDAIDTIARVTENTLNAPRGETLHQEIAYFIAHENYQTFLNGGKELRSYRGCKELHLSNELNFGSNAVVLNILTIATLPFTDGAVFCYELN